MSRQGAIDANRESDMRAGLRKQDDIALELGRIHRVLCEILDRLPPPPVKSVEEETPHG